MTRPTGETGHFSRGRPKLDSREGDPLLSDSRCPHSPDLTGTGHPPSPPVTRREVPGPVDVPVVCRSDPRRVVGHRRRHLAQGWGYPEASPMVGVTTTPDKGHTEPSSAEGQSYYPTVPDLDPSPLGRAAPTSGSPVSHAGVSHLFDSPGVSSSGPSLRDRENPLGGDNPHPTTRSESGAGT